MRSDRLLSMFSAVALLSCAHGHTTKVADAPLAVNERPVVSYTGLAAPDSALYDAAHDRYLISNVQGNPTARDNDGFISALAPDGTIPVLKWIEGGRDGVELNAPKGLAIADGLLYVTDISTVRIFDLETGAPKGEIDVRDATFLNDVATGDDGKVYVSDSGPPTGRWDAVGTEAVYVLDAGGAKPFARGQLGRPSGVLWSDGGLIVSPFGANELYRLDAHGKKRDVTPLPAGGLAGIAQLGDTVLVSSFQSSAIYHGKLGGEFAVLLREQGSPADIGVDTRRRRLLVPHFNENTVEVFQL